MKLPARQNPEAAVQKWNERHPVGIAVAVRLDNGMTRLTTTRSAAHVLSGHTAVVWLDGFSSCYLLERVSPVVAR
jgi:hypothetical protein